MDNPTFQEVRQTTLAAAAEGTVIRAPLLKMGVPVQASIWDLLALQGRMFNLTEPAQGTPMIGAAATFALTAPTIRFTVPSGYTVFPYRFNLAFEARAGTLNRVMVIASETDSCTSGVTAGTPQNWRTDNPRASVVTKVWTTSGTQVIVEAALTRPRSLYKWVQASAVAAVEPLQHNVLFPALIPIVGPASFLVYVSATGTAATFMFSLDWAEVPSANAI